MMNRACAARLPKDTRLLPKEGEEQARLFSWAGMVSHRYPELRLMFHVPNGGARNKTEAARFKAEGVKAGVPDIFLPVPRYEYHGLFIELKRLDGGRVSPEQKAWLEDLNSKGYKAVIAYGWEDASQRILDYLAEREEPMCAPGPCGEALR